MTDLGVPDDDMPIFSRVRREDVSATGDTSLAAMLDQTEPPAGMEAVAEALAALLAAPLGDELTGQAAAMAEFRQWFGVSHQPRRSRRRRSTLLTSLLRARAAAAAAAAALCLGGAALAAYTGALPAPVQRLAHDVIGAPSPKSTSHHPARSGSPTGPKVTGPAAFGLCNAYAHAKEHGTPEGRDVAFSKLVKVAGGADKVTSFCSAVQHPGTSATHRHQSGKPSSHSHGQQPAHHTGPPAHPTDPPSAHPTSRR